MKCSAPRVQARPDATAVWHVGASSELFAFKITRVNDIHDGSTRENTENCADNDRAIPASDFMSRTLCHGHRGKKLSVETCLK